MDNINIFYSWQCDLSQSTNQNAIRKAINTYITNFDSQTKRIILNEATSNESGSPDIPTTIFNKISSCDIFICDISLINGNFDGKKTPNPNVLIELGYASALLGWDRIIMVFNKAFGRIDDLPFDLEKKRCLLYELDEDKNKFKNSFDDLKEKIKLSINTILERNPSKLIRFNTYNVDQIKRERDMENIKIFLGCIDEKTIHSFVESLPYQVFNDIFIISTSLDDKIKPTFFLYDSVLLAKILNFKSLLEQIISLSIPYYGNKNSLGYHSYITPQTADTKELSNAQNTLNTIEENHLIFIIFFLISF
jgi:hypothetical protein